MRLCLEGVRLKFIKAITIAWFLTSSVVFAVSLTAEVDRQKTAIEEPFWLTITIQGSLDDSLKVPESQDFEFVKTGESTNISIVNGSVTKELQYTFQVRPLRQGSLSIPSFGARIDGVDQKTLPIPVEVAVTSPQQKNGVANDTNKIVFVERDILKTSVYEGEAIRTVGRLLTRTRLTGATPIRDPSPNWRVIPVDGQRNRDVNRDGVRYSAVEMDEVLIPLKPGELTVPQFGINASWVQEAKRPDRRRPHSVFDLFQHGMFSMGEEVSRKLLSEAASLHVKPLPTPKPANFSDIIGAFTLKSNVSESQMTAGDTVTITIELSGQGALDRMQEFKISVPGARVYDDKPELAEKIQPGAGLVSTKRFKFAIVPQQPGDLNLGSVNLLAFNPYTERYEKLTANLGTILVKEGRTVEQPVQGSNETKTTSVNEQKNQIAGDLGLLLPKRIEDPVKRPSPWWQNPWILAFEVLAVLLILAWFLTRKYVFPVTLKKSDIIKVRERCERLRADLKRGDVNVILGVIALTRDVLIKHGGYLQAMTSSDLLSYARRERANQSILDSLIRVLDAGDRLQYGTSNEVAISEQLASDITRLIDYCLTKDSHG